MKNRFIIFLIAAVTTITADGQNLSAFDPQPNFSAIIVHNIDSSVVWYKSVFRLEIKNQLDEQEESFRSVMLECSTFSIELIEKKVPFGPTEVPENKRVGTGMQGLFKIGFKVSDLDVFIKHLARLKIPIRDMYTDASSKKRNFLLNDPDGNVIQISE